MAGLAPLQNMSATTNPSLRTQFTFRVWVPALHDAAEQAENAVVFHTYVGVEHCWFGWQVPLRQSSGPRQPRPAPQRAQPPSTVGPPQSVPVSRPLATPSVHVGVEQVVPTHERPG